MDKEYAEHLLEKTRKDYNLLSGNYARTRAFIPKDLMALAEYALPGEKILDSGCANGRFFRLIKEKGADYFGLDISEKLIEIAKKDYPEAKFQVADGLSLPFPANFFDKIFSISVLHHIPSEEFRLQYLKEAKRVLKTKGFLILRVWDFWKRKRGWRLILKHAFLKLTGMSGLDFGDVFFPWKDSSGKVLIQRYFHCFTRKEIEKLMKKAGFKMKKSWRWGRHQRANIYIIAEK